MEVNTWGVFVDRSNGALQEIALPEELADKVWKFIKSLAEDDEEFILPRNLDPERKYKIW